MTEILYFSKRVKGIIALKMPVIILQILLEVMYNKNEERREEDGRKKNENAYREL